MKDIFPPYLCKFIIVFYDILIYSKSFVEHLLYLEKAFQVLVEGQFFLKLSKCLFAQRQVEYLGHLVLEQGVEPVPTKVEAIKQWLTHRFTRALRGFLGLLGFIEDLSKGMLPLLPL